jgi:hypothetical protein
MRSLQLISLHVIDRHWELIMIELLCSESSCDAEDAEDAYFILISKK